jgi:hypothetical protein
MVTSKRLDELVGAFADAADDERADILHSLVGLEPTEDQWRAVAPVIRQVMADLRTDVDALAGGLARVPLASVRRRLRDLAWTASPESRVTLLSALRAAGDTAATRALVETRMAELRSAAPGHDDEPAMALACLPVEDYEVNAADLRPALGSASADTRIWASIALARLGDIEPLDDLVRRLADGDVEGLLSGDLVAAFETLASVRPLPADLKAHLAQLLGDLEGSNVTGPSLTLLRALTWSGGSAGALISEEYARAPKWGEASVDEFRRLIEDEPEEVRLDVEMAEPESRTAAQPRSSGRAPRASGATPASAETAPRASRAEPQPAESAARASGATPPPAEAAPPTSRATPRSSRATPATAEPAPPSAGASPHSGARASETRRPEEPRIDTAPVPRGPRSLQARVTDAAGNERGYAFAPGQTHKLSLAIAPGGKGIVADRQFRESTVRFDQPFGAALDVEVLIEAPTGTVVQRQPMILPPTGSSSSVEVEIDVAADAQEVRGSILVFQRATLLQSAQLRGPVSAADEARDGERIRLVVDAEVSGEDPPESAEVDTSLSFHVGLPGEASLTDAGGNHRIINLPSLGAFRDQIIETLRSAVDVDLVEGATPGSQQQTELLRQLARQGHVFYQALAPELHGVTLGPRIQLISADDDVVPLEFVYDFGLPSEDAKLCKHWLTALATGVCSCRPREGERVGVVCPLGFWGLRYVVERQIASATAASLPGDPSPGQLRPGHETLPALDRVLFAATSRVDGAKEDERKETRKTLDEALHDRLVEVTSWSAWRLAVRRHKPGLLLALPHTMEVGGLVALQIGTRSVREVAALTREYVMPRGSAVGPVVMLLGCSTAQERISWQSAAAAMRRRGASVVIGTLVGVLGRQTAPMARHIAQLMWGPERLTGKTIGEVLQAVRRRSVASGATLGMSLVATGQTGWLVPPRGGDG